VAKQFPHLLELGRRIRARRESEGISQEDLAIRAKLHRTYIGGIERGERNVSTTNLLHICSALGIDAGQLLSGLTIKKR